MTLWSGWVKTKGTRWREVCRAAGWGECWTLTCGVRVLDDCERVVMELTLEHPQSRLNALWLHFHGVVRPQGPHADDAAEVVREAGFAPMTETWTQPRGGGFGRKEDLVAWTRRQLCLPADRDPEVAELLEPSVQERGGLYGFPDRPVMTIWWDGSG